jgi:uncharacterized membrane protein (UPF0136 family)
LLSIAFFAIGWFRSLRGSDQGEFLWLLAAMTFAGSLSTAASSEIPGLVISAGVLVVATRPPFYSRGAIAGGVISGSVTLIALVDTSSNDWGGLITATVGAVILLIAAAFLFASKSPGAPVPAANTTLATPIDVPAVTPPLFNPASVTPAPDPVVVAPVATPASAPPAQAFKTPPRGVRISDDKAYWWDEAEQKWQLLRISPDNYYYWDGITWKPRT